jgi:NAD(P)-dependent dehydrogenase (short-subunit alcohol dehydrogenase family)
VDLEGSIAVVSGGCGAIGSRIADVLIERGCRVARWDRQPTSGGGIDCDVADAASVSVALARTVAELGEPTILVNAAGVSGGRSPWPDEADAQTWPAVFSPEAIWRSTFDVNVLGVVNTTRAFAALHAATRRGGAVINLSSAVAQSALDPSLTAYTVGKAALNELTRIMARGLAYLDIRVNAIAPGVMHERMKVQLSEGLGARPASKHVAVSDIAREITPLGHRLVTPDDVAAAAVRLLELDFVTGQIVAVDGGLSVAGFGSCDHRIDFPEHGGNDS